MLVSQIGIPMATRKKKTTKNKPKKVARKKSPAKKKAPARRKTTRAAAKKAMPKPAYGSITHTEFASTDPDATKAWCARALGWKFSASMPTPDGPYHLFSYAESAGGGIAKFKEPDVTSTVPYVSVANPQKAVDKAVAAGAEVVMPVTFIMEGVTIAIVRAPGGVLIGLAGS
jgi:predicted enzyme related to lactoylglutathione lyase